jgi:hypothetical protein
MPVDDADDRSDARIDGKMPMAKISVTLPLSETAQLNEEIGDLVPLETTVSYSSYVFDASPFFALEALIAVDVLIILFLQTKGSNRLDGGRRRRRAS